MNKKLLAVAVAGALALPGVALAQSSVTISGFLKMGIDNVKLGNSAKSPSSEMRVQDDSSRIIFNVREDLGGGLAAIAQIDWRVTPDTGTDAISGNNHVGFVSKDWGRIFLGRQDIHYGGRESYLTAKGSLKADSISLLVFAGGGGTAIAGGTRTPNIIHYTTPNWGGFTMIAAYSTSPNAGTSVEADIGSTFRKGRAWNLNPNMAGRNYVLGYSYWNQKNDLLGMAGGNALASADQRGDRLYGSYRWDGLRVGLAWDKSKLKGATNGVVLSNRTAWSLPVSYTWGANEIHGHYTKARDDKATAGVNDGAKMFALSYQYSLSKRTALALTYAKITNETGAFYQLFTSGGALGSASAGVAAGEDPRILAATVLHSF